MSGKAEMKRIAHERIRASAASALRREGLSAVSVHRVMEGAGLTVGGFYAHYKSRGDMLEDAFSVASAERRSVVRNVLEDKKGTERLMAFVSTYLSAEHTANAESGCPWAAVLSDLPRSSETLRRKATEQFERSVNGLEGDRRASIATLALSFASLILMRMVTDEALQSEIAASARFAVESLLAATGKGENV